MKKFNICIIQPLGFTASLGFIDQARHIRYQLRKLDAEVTISKNRLNFDSVNIVLGAHLGFDEKLKEIFCCVFLNLEQLGSSGAKLSEEYLALINNSLTFDYDKKNLSFHNNKYREVPLISFGYSPYLSTTTSALEQRPIDILFFGSINERRFKIFERLLKCGVNIKIVDTPVYGEERDNLILQSKAVLNCHYYDSVCFEQARVFHCLSLETPVISEITPNTNPDEHFVDSVFWVNDREWEVFFQEYFLSSSFYSAARKKIDNFKKTDVSDLYRKLLNHALSYDKAYYSNKIEKSYRPKSLNIGSGKSYKLGWLNIDISEKTYPDLILDLSTYHTWPKEFRSPTLGKIVLEKECLEFIYADNVLEHINDLTQFMTNCLELLIIGGIFDIIVPYEKSNTAWQDPTHVRAMNENSWIYYSDWFWYLGWFNQKFEIKQFNFLDLNLQNCEKSEASFMKVKLVKTNTSSQDRVLARTMQADFGGIPDDLPH